MGSWRKFTDEVPGARHFPQSLASKVEKQLEARNDTKANRTTRSQKPETGKKKKSVDICNQIFRGCKCCYHQRRRKARKEVTACRSETVGCLGCLVGGFRVLALPYELYFWHDLNRHTYTHTYTRAQRRSYRKCAICQVRDAFVGSFLLWGNSCQLNSKGCGSPTPHTLQMAVTFVVGIPSCAHIF